MITQYIKGCSGTNGSWGWIVCLLLISACHSRDDLHLRATAGYIAQYNTFVEEDIHHLRREIDNEGYDPRYLTTTHLRDSAFQVLELSFSTTKEGITQVIRVAEQWGRDTGHHADHQLQPSWQSLYATLSRYYLLLDSLPAYYRFEPADPLAKTVSREFKTLTQQALARFNVDTDSLASAPIDEAAWVQRHFAEASPNMALAMVCNLQRDWLTVHRDVLSRMRSWQPAAVTTAIATQPVLLTNTSVLHSGDSLTIRAAIPTFDMTNTRVTMPGDSLSPGVYRFTAQEDPGQYTLPVHLQYKLPWQEGKPETYRQQINYTILR